MSWSLGERPRSTSATRGRNDLRVEQECPRRAEERVQSRRREHAAGAVEEARATIHHLDERVGASSENRIGRGPGTVSAGDLRLPAKAGEAAAEGDGADGPPPGAASRVVATLDGCDPSTWLGITSLERSTFTCVAVTADRARRALRGSPRTAEVSCRLMRMRHWGRHQRKRHDDPELSK